MKTVSVVHLFYDVHMGAGHKGLHEMFKKKAKTEAPKSGEIALFMNRKFTACKLLCNGNLLLYYRDPDGAYVTPEAVKVLPTVVGASRLRFARDLEKRLLDQLSAVESEPKRSRRRAA